MFKKILSLVVQLVRRFPFSVFGTMKTLLHYIDIKRQKRHTKCLIRRISRPSLACDANFAYVLVVFSSDTKNKMLKEAANK